MITRKFKNIDDFIISQPEDVQSKLKNIRNLIRKAVPKSEEAISYDIPTFKLNGHYVIWFAAYKEFISIYPLPTGSAALRKEMAPFVKGKGTLHFPLTEPIPYDLIKKIALARMKESQGE
jgi:uncharacterized protein YdhG (YjbR/CyaY superfamily)